MVKVLKKKASGKAESYYPADEQGILKPKTSDEKDQVMKLGEEDEEVYTAKGREKLEEDDELESWEEGFMEGATDAGQLGKDALTGEPLLDVEDVVELEFEGKMYRFVNQKNARKFVEKRSAKKWMTDGGNFSLHDGRGEGAIKSF